ncbi:MAG: sialate O-acetylesterase [Phenylobacterium sp.]|uniref:sialate O-acetylesterase n=1 Tax=Phenylobacterium sp. TaxID=1871053 RepID=UPI0027166E0C|nr:sialate O-acetylesterase [Phenylobacterium sp.]MDO9430936.1 sialate O-acetylesterase [Phenylobacterium sp.]
MDSPNYGSPADCPSSLIVVAGQSNALGYTLGPADLPPHLRKPIAKVQIWDPARHAFAPLQPGVNTGSLTNPGAWGPESQLAFRWSQGHPCGDLRLVKYARGETGLAATPNDRDWSPSSHDDVWDKATAELDAAKAALKAEGLPRQVAAVFWMQGETDAQDPAKAKAYRQNLTDLVIRIRARWGDDQTKVYVGQIDRPPGSKTWEQVRQAQAAVAASVPDVHLIDTDLFPRQPADNTHFTGAGQVQLGDGFFDQYRAR